MNEIRFDADKAPVVLQGEAITRMFGFGKNAVKAVDGVNFKFRQGEIISIVGESGSGKTTIMRMLMGLIRPSAGVISYNGNLIDFRNDRQRKAYWQKVQAIFQDPFASFNQFFRIEKIFYDCLKFKGLKLSKKEVEDCITKACSFVNLKYAELRNKYPFELSGGQMQRLMIARIFLLEPQVLIADEPTSMVDACSRSTILEMLMRLREQNKMTIIFITHDLGLAYYVSNSIYIMQKGRFVEGGDARDIIIHPKHEYTRRLLADVPKLNETWILE